MRLLLISLACVLGCGGTSDTIYPLAGTAWTQRIADRKCDHQMTFAEDGQYLASMICYLADNSQAAQVDKGTFYVNDGTLTVTLDESSCATNASGSVEFAYYGDSLHIFTSTGGILMMSRLNFPPGEPTGVQIGCFDGDTWVFTPMDVHSI
jgi:hypothetical protein